MFTLYLFILLVYLNVHIDTHDLEVISSGVSKLKQNDMMVIFYMSIQHHGSAPRRVMATMIECCEIFTESDQDCDLIDLYGGDFGVMQPGSLRNLSMIYPNLYGYNRKGYCVVSILHRSMGQPDITEIHHRIEFDTRVKMEVVPQMLEGWYDPDTIVLCETPDLDPLDHCNPVDCRLKYSGYRNYYNQKVKMCQRAPVCLTNLEKELPDIVYIPTKNKCRNLDAGISKEDIAKLASPNASTSQSETRMVDIRCHHGEVDPKTGLCICDYGWKSEPFDPDSYVPGKSIYSMCTIRCKREDLNKHLPALVGLILAMWLFFFVFCCEKHDLFSRSSRSIKGSSSQIVYYPLNGNISPNNSNILSKNGSFNQFQHNYVSHFSTTALNKPIVKTKRKRFFLFH